MTDEDSKYARAAILEVVENQIEGGTPPETTQTMERLKGEGYSEDDAMRLIGCIVASELFAVLKDGRGYDERAYIRALNRLPKLPWE